MNESGSFNPYQAPATQEYEDVVLSEEAEFLISGREILCRESVNLPKVCIHTGQTKNLQQRQETFLSARVLFAGVGGLIVPAAVLILLFSGRIGWGLILIIGLMFWGAALLPLAGRLGFPGTVSIRATWYVSDEYLRRCRQTAWFIRLAIVVIMFLFGFLLGYQTSMAASGATGTGLRTAGFLAGICGVISLTLRTERRIRLAGRRRRGPHRDLFALTGHSRRFSEAVDRINHGAF